MSDAGSSDFQANLQRGELLRDQHRYPEAEKYLQEAIALEPARAEGYYELAFCYCNWDGHEAQGLATIDRAIGLDPNHAEFFALRAWILGNLDRNQEAINVAHQALILNPTSILALNAQTRAYNDLKEWRQSEIHARRVLALNANNNLAGNFLAIALRQQGRAQESEAVTAGLLSRAPDGALTQCNAGWSALQAGDPRRANRHFLEALRLKPNYDSARLGLLHSFSSRVWIYRLFFQYALWLGRHKKGMRIFFILTIYMGYRLAIVTLRTEFGPQGLQWGLVLVAFYLILFGFGRSFGNLFLLLDPFARHALTGKEKAWSILAGLVYGLLIASLISQAAWPQAGVLLVIVGLFLWNVLIPRFQDAFRRATPVEVAANEPHG
jgi:tetratricopeptide (TPR) repeat protein